MELDLAGLMLNYPSWSFSIQWFAANSGPDRCVGVARRGEITLTAWTAEDLSLQLATAERQMGY